MAKWLTGIIVAFGYPGLIILMFLENLIPPVPSEFIMPMAGYMVSEGHFKLLWIILFGTFGSVAGTLPLYYWGRSITEEKLHQIVHKHGRWLTITHRDIRTSKRWFDEYGAKALLFGRLVPGVRSIISLPAGMGGMKIGPFLLYTVLATLVWDAALAYAGYFLGSQFTMVRKYMSAILAGVFAVIVIIYLIRVWKHKKEG
jgi:membrane protein DedA with SNARE-associated domain